MIYRKRALSEWLASETLCCDSLLWRRVLVRRQNGGVRAVFEMSICRRLAHNGANGGGRSSDVAPTSQVETFEALLLSKRTLSGLNRTGFQQPSPIQAKAIPMAKCGVGKLTRFDPKSHIRSRYTRYVCHTIHDHSPKRVVNILEEAARKHIHSNTILHDY